MSSICYEHFSGRLYVIMIIIIMIVIMIMITINKCLASFI